jgi:hypothetical protein
VPLWKDDAGNVYNAVIGTTATSNQFLTNITAAGVQTKAQPAFSNLSGTSTAAQTATSVLDDSVAYCADAGSNDTYACSLSPAPASYTTGGRYRFKANTANTGAATINFNSLGAKTIKSVAGGVTTDLSDNQIRVGQVVELVYDGTNMQMISPTGNQITRALSFTFGDPAGSALSAGSTTTVYIAVPFSCTVAAWNILVDGGTATVKFWKKASGTAIPTSSDSINTSGVSISTGTAVRSTTLSDFTTTSISANDILAANITTVSSSKYLNATLECNQ